MKEFLEVLRDLGLGALGSLIAAGLLFLLATQKSKRLREYFFEVLGLPELANSYRNALGNLLKRQERLRQLNDALLKNPYGDGVNLQQEMLDAFHDVNRISTDFQVCQDRLDQMLSLKKRLLDAVSKDASYRSKDE